MKKAHYYWQLCIFLALLMVLSGCSCNNIIDHGREDDMSQTHATEKTIDFTDNATVTTTIQTEETSQIEDDTKIIFRSEQDEVWGISVINADGSNLKRLADCDVFSISPDGSKMVYASGNDVYNVDMNGSNKTFLAEFDEGDYVSSQVFSPDGSRIAFVLSKTEYPIKDRLFVINADGTNLRLLVEKGPYIVAPSFSPDGSEIMYSFEQDVETFETFIIDADGSKHRALADGYGHSFSPDGSQILIESFHEDIHIIDSDGSNFRFLAYGWGSSFSPDGSRIYYCSLQENNDLPYRNYGIFKIDSDGSNQKHLADGYNPSVSPDRTQIAFASYKEDAGAIYIMDVDGSNQKLLACHNSWLGCSWPSFSSDGSMIVFYARAKQAPEDKTDFPTHGIYIMNADGSNMRFLAEGQTASFVPVD